MNIAFLQCQWLHDPAKAQRAIELYGEKYRRALIAYALFSGCLTGRRIRAAFDGEQIDIKSIRWENASPRIAGRSSGVFPADPEHMRRAIEEERPGVILLFGKVAFQGFNACIPAPGAWKFTVITGPHPAARHATVAAELASMAADYRAAITATAGGGT